MSRRKSIGREKTLPLRESRSSDELEDLEDDTDCLVKKPSEVKQPHDQLNVRVLVGVVVGVGLGLYVILNFNFLTSLIYGPDDSDIQTALVKVLKDMRRKFPAQKEKLWTSLWTVLATVSSSSCPKVILLLDQGDALSQSTSRCVVEMVANLSAPELPFEEKNALVLNGDDLNCVNCLEAQREKVGRHGIVVIQHLEKFPIVSAASLHFFCDEHETEFAKAVYLLTMTVSNIQKDATKTAENALRTSWKSMQKDNLEALISRLTSLVVFVEPETNLSCE